MIIIKTPATSANVGVGFDCLGLALQLYNTFYVEPCNAYTLEGVEEKYANEENLFIQSYKKACQYLQVKELPLHIRFEADVPVSRGLGSSATLIVAGITACYAIHGMEIDKETILQIASAIEGHPDNVAPCIYGGLCASYVTEDKYHTLPLQVHKDIHFTLAVPDFEVSTEKARELLPSSYARKDVVNNIACVLAVSKGMETGEMDKIMLAEKDTIHEPYRKPLIHGFDIFEKAFKQQTQGCVLISGSGSTILGISTKTCDISVFQAKLPSWKFYAVPLDTEGVQCKEI